MAKNIYGVQKVKEPEVRDGLDVAGATAQGAAQAAQIGAKYGPWAAAGAAVVGGAYAYTQQKKMQREEEMNLRHAKDKNLFVDSLEGRNLREDTMVSAQARYGMDSNNRYETAEIEGDGSGSADGIGEIHVDKDYNIKNIARGGERHEDGGFKINNLEKEDVIFPTQNNEQEFNRVLGAINRWKLKRDPRAKKFLDRTRDRLPTDEDYGYDTKEFPKGKGKAYGDYIAETNEAVKQAELKKKMFEEQYPNIDYDWYLRNVESGDFDDTTIPAEITQAWYESEEFNNPSEEQLAKEAKENERLEKENRPGRYVLKDEELNRFTDSPFVTGNFGDPFEGMSQLDKDEYLADQQKQKELEAKGEKPGNYEKPLTQDEKDYFQQLNRDRANENTFYDPKGINNSSAPAVKTSPTKKSSDGGYTFVPGGSFVTDPNFDATGTYDAGQTEEQMARSSKKPGDYEAYQKEAYQRRLEEEKKKKEEDAQKVWDEITKMEDYNNPGKYASAINKAIQGSKPIEGVERRFIDSEKYKYEDMSAKDRQDNIEARNFQNQTMRGKGLTAAQRQSYNAQNAAQYYSNAEKINAAENKKRYEIANANVDLTNQDKIKNLTLANQYDDIERKQRAIQQRYKDSSYSDYAQLSQLDEQKRYMMNKDRKMFLRDQATLPYLGTKNMQIGPAGVYYVKDEDGNFVEYTT